MATIAPARATAAQPRTTPAAGGADLDLFVSETDAGRRQLNLHVPGVHCAGCIRKIEGALWALPGVSHARVNFTTRRLAAEWDPALQSASAIVAAVEGAGFEARPYAASDAAAGAPDPASRRLLKSMAVAGFAAMNIMLLSVSVWSGADGATRNLFHLISACIALPAVAYAGQPFFASAWGALKQKRTNMDVPISIGVILATLISLFETFTGGRHAYFDAATMLLFFLLVGRYLDSLMRDRARAGVATLLKQSARGALVRAPDGSTEYRPIEAVAPGMTVLVAAGERIPVDGIVTEGRSGDRPQPRHRRKPARSRRAGRRSAGGHAQSGCADRAEGQPGRRTKFPVAGGAADGGGGTGARALHQDRRPRRKPLCAGRPPDGAGRGDRLDVGRRRLA